MNKHKFILLFIACCVLPLLAAKLVLTFGWFNAGVSSQGQWQQQEVFLLPASEQKAHWRLAIAPANDCQQLCKQALHTVQQLYVGLGRKQEQVMPVWLTGQTLPSGYTVFEQQQALLPVPQQLQDRIMLVDQQGLVLLSYPMPVNEAEMAPTAKAIRHDLLKLLNYDRTSV